MAKRQLTAFLPSLFREEVEAIRTRWDSETARRIAAHVTIVHDLDQEGSLQAARDLLATRPELTVRLTHAKCWGTPEGGIYLAAEDPYGELARVRRDLRIRDMPGIRYEPHVTLVHPRTTTKVRSQAAWESVAAWTIDEEVVLNDLALIELRGSRWHVVARTPMA